MQPCALDRLLVPGNDGGLRCAEPQACLRSRERGVGSSVRHRNQSFVSSDTAGVFASLHAASIVARLSGVSRLMRPRMPSR